MRTTTSPFVMLITLSLSGNHPAAESELPPPALILYYKPPATRALSTEEAKFEGSPIALAFRCWNSQHGVTTTVFHTLLTSTTLCAHCRRTYSFDGLRDHLVDGYCCNSKVSYRLPLELCHGVSQCITLSLSSANFLIVQNHRAANSSQPPPELLPYVASDVFLLVEVPDYLTSPIGRMLVEWNSRRGVPLDSWYTATTATVYCSKCRRNRSFDGHRSHLAHPESCIVNEEEEDPLMVGDPA